MCGPPRRAIATRPPMETALGTHMPRVTLIVLATVAVLVFAGCANGSTPATGDSTFTGPAARLLDPARFKAEAAQRFLVNVHIPDEGNIDGTDARIPFDQVRQQISKFPADKNAPIALYCKSGRMSAIAAKELQGLGYTNVIDLRGGMNAWEQAGFALSYP